MMDNIFTNNFMCFVRDSIAGISFDVVLCLITFVTFVKQIMCSLMHEWKNFTIFVLEILLKYKVTDDFYYLCGPIKKLIFFFTEIKERVTFPGMGLIS